MDKLPELLINVGVPKITANVFAFLLNGEPRTSRQIERSVDIRQPEASIALKNLHGFVSVSERASTEKGRPNKVYQMSKKQGAAYLKRIADEKQKEIDAVAANLEEIREMIEGDN
ncbi:MAG: ArsR family transcriptional regulator [Alphaproteobacteria bacterium]|nr:ArsR family transcriptional regulator [Alphaproteobacteria bacterium]